MASRHTEDLRLVSAALKGLAGADERLIRSIADTVWTASKLATATPADAEAAFRETIGILQADSFSRLAGYDGRCPLATFVAFIARDVLALRAVRLLALYADRGWRAIEAFFAADIRRQIDRRLPGPQRQQAREDAYQAICLGLVEDNYRRLRTYDGHGSFSGFVLHMTDRLVIDYLRTILTRRRMPASIIRLPDLEQRVFRLVYWHNVTPQPDILAADIARHTGQAHPPDSVAQAWDKVRQALPAHFTAERGHDLSLDDLEEQGGQLADDRNTPEEHMLAVEAEWQLGSLVAALKTAQAELSALEQLYLRHILAGYPAREIASLMGCPVAEVYKLAQQVKRQLKNQLKDAPALKNWLASV